MGVPWLSRQDGVSRLKRASSQSSASSQSHSKRARPVHLSSTSSASSSASSRSSHRDVCSLQVERRARAWAGRPALRQQTKCALLCARCVCVRRLTLHQGCFRSARRTTPAWPRMQSSPLSPVQSRGSSPGASARCIRSHSKTLPRGFLWIPHSNQSNRAASSARIRTARTAHLLSAGSAPFVLPPAIACRPAAFRHPVCIYVHPFCRFFGVRFPGLICGYSSVGLCQAFTNK